MFAANTVDTTGRHHPTDVCFCVGNFLRRARGRQCDMRPVGQAECEVRRFWAGVMEQVRE